MESVNNNIEKVTCVILCAGEATRWGNYLGVKKHFIKIEGEPLLNRTVRLFKKYCKVDHKIHVIAHSKEYHLPGTELYIPKHNIKEYGEADKYLCSEELWNKSGRTIVLLGDVWFSEYAMETIVEYQGSSWKAFGRVDSNFLNGCLGGELFSQSFLNTHINQHKKQLLLLGQIYKQTKIEKASGWGHLNLMLKLEIQGHHIEKYLKSPLFTEINDFTNDFDFPSDYTRWIDNKTKVFNPKASSIYNLGKNPKSWDEILSDIKVMRNKEQYQICYFMTSYAYQEIMKYKQSDNPLWRKILLELLFEFSIVGYYVERFKFSLFAVNKILFCKYASPKMKSHTLENMRYYVNKLEYLSCEPTVISSVDQVLMKSKYREYPVNWKVIPIFLPHKKNQMLTITEEGSSLDVPEEEQYLFHRFMLLNQNKDCIGLSLPFYIRKSNREQCLDLKIIKDVCHITVKDTEEHQNKTYLVKIKESTVLGMIEELMQNIDI